MIFETKFDFEDRVWLIRNDRVENWVDCPTCAGTGEIVGADHKCANCPSCYGRGGRTKYLPTQWQAVDEMTIGEIRVESRSEYTDGEDNIACNIGHQEAKHEEIYMCRETGIGSGTLWSVEDLFATREEAEAECLCRNAVEVPA